MENQHTHKENLLFYMTHEHSSNSDQFLKFYVLYAIQNVFDSEFYGLGKTNYMLFESIVTNLIYYGVAFILYLTGKWVPSLMGIALLFGIGNAFDSIVSAGAYCFLLKKKKINILKVE